MSANLCATLGNVRIMEIDIDDVPWKDELVTHPPQIVAGHMTIPQGPGWGTAVNEEVARAHVWDPRKAAHARTVAPARSFKPCASNPRVLSHHLDAAFLDGFVDRIADGHRSQAHGMQSTSSGRRQEYTAQQQINSSIAAR